MSEQTHIALDRNDYIYRIITRVIGRNPVLLSITYFLISFVMMYIFGYLYGGEEYLSRMKIQLVDNINMGFLAPVGAGLLSLFYIKIEGMFDFIKDSGAVKDSEKYSVEEFIDRKEKFYNSRIPFFVALSLSLAFNTYNYIYKTDSFLSISGGPPGLYGRFFIVANYTMIILIIYKYFVTIWSINSVFARFKVLVRPLHPDGAGGLKKIGDTAISANYFMALVVLFVTILMVFDPFATSNPIYITILIICYPLAITSFFLSLSKAHQVMVENKDRVLRKLGRTFDKQYGEENTEEEDQVFHMDQLGHISDISSMYQIAVSMPVWPFDTSSLIRFGTSYAIPALIFIFQQVVSKYLTFLGSYL